MPSSFNFYELQKKTEQFGSVAQLCLTLCTPWTAMHQSSLSITNSWNLLKLTSIETVMPSNHLVLCRPAFIFSCLQFFLASVSFPMSQFFTLGGQSIGLTKITTLTMSGKGDPGGRAMYQGHGQFNSLYDLISFKIYFLKYKMLTFVFYNPCHMFDHYLIFFLYGKIFLLIRRKRGRRGGQGKEEGLVLALESVSWS